MMLDKVKRICWHQWNSWTRANGILFLILLSIIGLFIQWTYLDERTPLVNHLDPLPVVVDKEAGIVKRQFCISKSTEAPFILQEDIFRIANDGTEFRVGSNKIIGAGSPPIEYLCGEQPTNFPFEEGMYRIQYTVRYHVNPIQDRVIKVSTEEFEW